MNQLSRYYFIISICAFILGGIFYMWYYQMLIIRWPSRTATYQLHETKSQAKNIKICWYAHKKWNNEEYPAVITQDIAQDAQLILLKLFEVLKEERLVVPACNIQSVVIDQAQELYISFTANPLAQSVSTRKRLLLLQSILCTLANNDLSISGVHFLVQHQPLSDPLLDFSQKWPLSGFIS